MLMYCADRHRNSRRGWSVIELIVTAAIALVLISLSLMALQQARESARRMQCQNNLRQVNMGLQAFHNAEQHLPSLYNGTSLAYPLSEWDLFHLHSWRSMLLPYVEQSPLYGRIAWDKLATEDENIPIGQSAVPIYLCPSSGSPEKMGQGLKHACGTMAPTPYAPANYYQLVRSDYDAMAGIQVLPDPIPAGKTMDSTDFVRWGVWGWPVFDQPEIAGTKMHSYQLGKFGHVSDGLSNTIMVTERGGKPYLYKEGKRIYFPEDPNPEMGYPGQVGWSASSTFRWSIHSNQVGVNENNGSGPYSLHPSGANVAIADGSVHFLSDNVSFETLVSLYGRADGGLPFDPSNPQ